VKGLHREGVLTDINFEIRRGEIVGFGAARVGRTELLHACRLDPIDGGTISWHYDDGPVEITPDRLRAHVGLVTEGSPREGVLLTLSVSDNMMPIFMSLLNRWRLIMGAQNRLAATVNITGQPGPDVSAGAAASAKLVFGEVFLDDESRLIRRSASAVWSWLAS